MTGRTAATDATAVTDATKGPALLDRSPRPRA
ncbi:hypothetical protein GA0115246_113683 [Streptomyces sp. SolWspMP-sol7th]|nr:hypothetical protein GA0115246_113683 [Streptomyces sp. SolWspMP-sol7th]